jgi:hypothetical protein
MIEEYGMLEYGPDDVQVYSPDDPDVPYQFGAYVVWRADAGTVAYVVDDLKDAEKYARLFQAAPSLLEALEEMLDAYAPQAQETADVEGEDYLHSAVRHARRAIASARGEDQ